MEWQNQPAEAGLLQANLLDGLSEESTDELHAVCDCLHRTGSMEPLGNTVDALDAPARR
ncbi:MAG: hypothetical protein H6741_10960 [Alphaproteobacteria bacterium]|nr:hypothetical protein [Alphaproteobacteria bacterium]